MLAEGRKSGKLDAKIRRRRGKTERAADTITRSDTRWSEIRRAAISRPRGSRENEGRWRRRRRKRSKWHRAQCLGTAVH